VDPILIGMLALLAIAASAWLGPRVRIAAPLLLVLVGIAVSLWPSTPVFEVDPEWILAGILPPLLYSAAVSMPITEFRRDFAAISGLAVLLVIVTSFAIGWVMSRVIPGIDFATGLALGAILSPTDAVATSIVKRLGVAPRVVVVLEGESLLNDATALVLLRTAIGASAVSISLFHIGTDFLYSVIVAVIIGALVGWLNLAVRMRAADATVNTALSLTVPFIAAIPAEHLGASGLVAAVVAGLITGFNAPRYLSPAHRLADRQNWRLIEFVLEGAVFLIMGLELEWIMDEVHIDEFGVPVAFRYAALALLMTVVIRALYIIPLIYILGAASRRADAVADVIKHHLLEPVAERRLGYRLVGRPAPTEGETIHQFHVSWQRRLADIDYFRNERIGWREGSIIVWAGMRGAVTLAAAQTLPKDTPSRSLLVLTAFLVAAASLLIQGYTLPVLVRRVLPPSNRIEQESRERKALSAKLRAAGTAVLLEAGLDPAAPFPDLASGPMPPANPPGPEEERAAIALQMRMIEAQRAVLLAARDNGAYSSETLGSALAALDASEIDLQIRGGNSRLH